MQVIDMEDRKLNVIFASYREWAEDVSTFVYDHPCVNDFVHAMTPDVLADVLHDNAHKTDLVMLCGWSWPPEQWMVNAGPLVISEHPAASDKYSPGTPLQNQIIDGLKATKHQIVKVGYPELSLRQWSHEVDMSLEGHMDEILQRMRDTSIELFDMFLRDYPGVRWKQWPIVPSTSQRSRRTPEMSNVSHRMSGPDHSLSFKAKEMYDMIRCLESPYPNAYVEDDTGRLYFERVRFEPKEVT